MVILGIDPGYATLGYGVIEYRGNHMKVLDYGAVCTTPDLSFPRRLHRIYEELLRIIENYRVEEAAIEELFFSKNTKTAMQVAHARGCILLACQSCGVPSYEYTPMQVKQGVCGYGGADKTQVQKMIKTLLNLKEVPKPDDVADALAIAVCHSHTNQWSRSFRI